MPPPYARSAAIGELHRLMSEPRVARERIVRLIREGCPGDPNLDRVEAMLADVLEGHAIDWRDVVITADERPYAAHLLSLPDETDRTAEGVVLREPSRIGGVGRNDDVVAALPEQPATVLRMVNTVANLSIVPTRTAAVVSSARNEGISLLEWVAHYRVLGFDGIFIYTNDNIDASSNLLEALARNGAIYLLHNDLAVGTPTQQKWLNHALHLLRPLRDFRWAFFVDTDELLVLPARFDSSIGAYLRGAETVVGADLAAVCLNWRWFGSDRAYARTAGLLLERFQQGHSNEHVKSIVRLRDAMSMHHVHIPVLPQGRVAVTSSWRPCPELAPEMPADYAGGQLNHYWNKSFQEFAFKRMRGYGTHDEDARGKDFDKFFLWGQAVRPNEPPSARLVERVKQEIALLLELPGVAEASTDVERRFCEVLATYESDLGLREIYERHMRS